ncbi:hypothetical protein SBX64_12115 [Vibrio rhizosphaerae]|uniref:Uncharacterized protein n=1 Tax=Vibrio rhizosphaerae TaxID=398736 RepID=A0ABU4IV56_9VIBR|nr:hypothetical protein [Vibrio rhizosphaerae]MDW6093294.1 hypothetical protein [Vibrio rhizosphaerae]
MRLEKVIAHQTPALQILSSQPWAPKFDAQLRSSISETLLLSAPVHLSEMKDEPENLFLLGLGTRFPEPAFTGVLPGKA